MEILLSVPPAFHQTGKEGMTKLVLEYDIAVVGHTLFQSGQGYLQEHASGHYAYVHGEIPPGR
jgi:hypothetical protein